MMKYQILYFFYLRIILTNLSTQPVILHIWSRIKAGITDRIRLFVCILVQSAYFLHLTDIYICNMSPKFYFHILFLTFNVIHDP